MVRSARLRFVLGSGIAVAALLSACGGDDGEDAASSTAPAAVEELTDQDDDATGTSLGEPADDRDPFCDAYDDIDDATSGLANDTIEDMRTGAEVIQEAVATAQAQVPAEIEEDFAVLAGSIDDLRQLAEDADTLEEFQAAVKAYDESAIEPYGDAVDAWYDDNC